MMIYYRKIAFPTLRNITLVLFLSITMLSTAQTPTFIDAGWREYLRSVVELDGHYYAVGTLGYEDETRDAVVVKYTSVGEYTCEAISTPDSNMFFSDITSHNGRLFVTGAIGSKTEEVYNRHFIGELTADLELLWKMSYEYYESISKVYGDYIVAGNNTIFVGSLIKIDGIKYGMVNSYSLTGDSLDHFLFENQYSQIDDMIHNLDTTGLILVGKRFEPGGYPTYAELSYNFETISIDNIESNYYRDNLSLKQDTDSTFILGCRILETGFPGGVDGYTQHNLNRLDDQFNIGLLTTQGDFGEYDDPAWNNSIDFQNSDTIFFAATHNGSFTYPPSNPSQLWTGFANNQLITQGIVKLGGENNYFEARDMIATSDGGCVVVGEHWDLSNEIAKMDLMIVKIEPEHFGPTPVSNIPAISANIRIAPNPVTDKVKVALTDIPKTAVISIYNIHGQIMEARRCTKSEIAIPCKHWNNGIYFYSVINRGEKIAAGKIVKKK